jgi:uncharacterized membrane protein
MSVATAPIAPVRSGTKLGKYTFWTLMGLAGISVLIWTDYPLLRTASDYRTKLIHDHLFLIPHAIAGVLATVLGQFQFSTRFRQRHLAWHRLMGKVYVITVCVAAPMVILLGRGFGAQLRIAGDTQASIWLLCTLCAFLTARNRHITVHRQWMIRSYAFTLNFIFSRLLNPIPAYFNLSENAFSVVLWLLTVSYLVVTQVAFSWRELVHKRA